jgi:YgiT-type zinc finger domain-containing protein
MSNTKKIRKCPECGGNVEPGKTEMVYDLQYRVRINNVPANICDKCGEVFIGGQVAGELDRLVDCLIADVERFAKSQPQIQNGSRSKEIAIAV